LFVSLFLIHSTFQELGGNAFWFDRFLAQHIAIFYYFMTAFMYALSPRMACEYRDVTYFTACYTLLSIKDFNACFKLNLFTIIVNQVHFSKVSACPAS